MRLQKCRYVRGRIGGRRQHVISKRRGEDGGFTPRGCLMFWPRYACFGGKDVVFFFENKIWFSKTWSCDMVLLSAFERTELYMCICMRMFATLLVLWFSSTLLARERQTQFKNGGQLEDVQTSGCRKTCMSQHRVSAKMMQIVCTLWCCIVEAICLVRKWGEQKNHHSNCGRYGTRKEASGQTIATFPSDTVYL